MQDQMFKPEMASAKPIAAIALFFSGLGAKGGRFFDKGWLHDAARAQPKPANPLRLTHGESVA